MTIITKDDGERKLLYDEVRLRRYLETITKRFPHVKTQKYITNVMQYVANKDEIKADQIIKRMIHEALDRVGIGNSQHPDFTYIASEILLRNLYKQVSQTRCYDSEDKYGDFYSFIRSLTTKGIFSPKLLEVYTKEEIKELGGFIDPSKDLLFTYIGLQTLMDRYLAKGFTGAIYELPQERFMIIAMNLMSNEKPEKRISLVKECYWAISNLYMTVATPTLTNSGKASGQLSSCFIDTVDDSLRSIYDTNTDIATLSKWGGGIGIYLGKVRARGSDIRGYKGVSSGVIPWMKLYNQTAVSVDQLGQRNGAVAVYLDVWHKDILSFLDAKLNNGDERLRTHDLFTGVCLPDLFMEKVEKREDWYLFCPHEVRKVMGFSLEDFYDESKGRGSFREKYESCIQNNQLSMVKVPAIEIMKRIMKSQLETGTPYMFYRDEVNRMNPNKHEGMVYSSNLCTEIMQNMSSTKVIEEVSDGEKINVTKLSGDFVVCNLSSINLGRAVPDDVLERLIPIQVRMLDNVIDLNEKRIEVPQAVMTNQKYRAIGLGTFGWHHLLALKGIRWESDEAVEYADELYEKIAYLTIQSSMNLATEKGSYPVFRGSGWETGEYFKQRGYDFSDRFNWAELRMKIAHHGIRNGYLLAIAPNGSTALIGGSTASIDPIFSTQYVEEKKDYKIPVTAPDLSPKTMWHYKPSYHIDQKWSIFQNAARQKHIDQAQSFNLYVTHDIHAKDFLELHLLAWKSGLKTTYYVRSTSIEIEECDACAS
ncbi:ribonucleoside-diphosphate reductase alpha chain [Thermoactinomyces sp. DSM 45891]|uniref:ribonucleoside-diphosphate reductase subunit alpha n=1 Tax=Thermoactinomyces sp. DSM 45891 TaxID=1761907 RepID=UPI000912782B|nr:ribonucleoside-diphosphate reductase subunit alpha [Thermoactinomyces sp. DSM 45891]SFX47880.1 ribonucleoside-diphosphate reductase alpha chain [Thermoactinomyces sp. DSM 45891]